jgi:hypothetical protein
MTTTQELLDHLAEKQAAVNNTINTVHEVRNNGTKYKAADKTRLVDAVKASDAACSICQGWQG